MEDLQAQYEISYHQKSFKGPGFKVCFIVEMFHSFIFDVEIPIFTSQRRFGSIISLYGSFEGSLLTFGTAYHMQVSKGGKKKKVRKSDISCK